MPRHLHALAVVAAVRVALWILPSALVLRGAGRITERRLARAAKRAPARHEAVRTAAAVRRTARAVPAATCLTQALAGQILLATAGCRSHLRLGVAQGAQGQFQAHAWLETEWGVVLGGGQLSRYTRLPDLRGVVN